MEISFKDLEKLVKKPLPRKSDALWDIFSNLKSEVENIEGDNLKIELTDTNRPDLWCVEGFARSLKTIISSGKVPDYYAKSSNSTVVVGKGINKVRPFIATAVLKNVKLNDEMIKQIMQFSERLDTTVGRKRAKTSIGIYNHHMIKFPVHYKLVSPKTKFVPLGFSEKMTMLDILEKHPKGVEYGHILKGLKKYPVLVDSKGKILSMPPIINSNDLGRVTEKTRELFVEVTGTHKEAVKYVLNNIVLAFADRGATVHSSTINYNSRKERTPDLSNQRMQVEVSEINRVTGLKMKSKEIVPLLSKMGYGVSRIKESFLDIIIPCYRSDILSEIDVIEDIAIAYGFNNIEPKKLRVPSTGEISDIEKISNTSREILVGAGFQEITSFTLVSKELLLNKMNVKDEDLVEVANPLSQNAEVLRNRILPSTLEVLEKNTHREYPQKIFECGDAVVCNKARTDGTETIRCLCSAIADNDSDFTRIKSVLDVYMNSIGVKYVLKPVKHPSFIDGRTAEIIVDSEKIGIIGEIHPQVLENFKISVPVSVFEIEL